MTSDDESLKPQRCGNGVCAGKESCSTCAADCGACPATPSCGDGTCNGTETCSTCLADCGSCSPTASCGDGTCNGTETCSTCLPDCRSCSPTASCGDGTCDGSELCSTCAADCGVCASAPARIAFVSDRSGVRSIYLANPDGSDVAFLTTGEAPAWSADGRRIAFHRPGIGTFVIDANGSSESFLRAGWNPTWSPDGTEIAFNSTAGSGGGVYVMNSDGSSPRLLLSHEFASPGWGDYCACSPAWSPDGTTIAFVRQNYDEAFAIYTMNADGSGSPSPLPGNGWFQDRPAWSPDGTRIAFDTGGSGGDQVASVTLSGSDLEVHATNATGYVGDPAWSPDGRTLLLTRSSPRGSPTRIFIVRDDGSVAQLIPEAQNPAKPDYWDREPTWSWGR